jgi:hypothetical protein
VTTSGTLQLQAFAQAGEDVRRLFDAQNMTEGSWGWFQALADTTLRGETASLAVLRMGGKPVAALPLATRGNGMRALCAPYTTCYRPALGEAGVILGAELGKRVQYRLDLDAIDPDYPGMAAFLQGLGDGGLKTASYAHFANWHDSISDFAGYWQMRPGPLRTTVQRKTLRLERPGRLAFTEIDLAQNSAKGLDLYQRIYQDSWKEPEPDPDFIPALFRLLGPTGELRMGAMRIDGEPVAVQLWLVKGRSATIFKLAHRSGFDDHSPGTLLTHWLLRLFVEQGAVRQVDFGRGDDSYKRLWLGQCRQRRGVVAFNTATARGLYGALRELVPTRLAAWRTARKRNIERSEG